MVTRRVTIIGFRRELFMVKTIIGSCIFSCRKDKGKNIRKDTEIYLYCFFKKIANTKLCTNYFVFYRVILFKQKMAKALFF